MVPQGAPYFAGREGFLLAIATEAGREMGDQLEAALVAVDEPLDQLAEVAETYVRFVLAHKVGFDLIFAAELRSSDDHDLPGGGSST
jgi:AcrR family transcriptional regulator